MLANDDGRVCPSCGSAHLGKIPCGLTFRERLLTVRMDASLMETRSLPTYYDSDAVKEQFGEDAKERLLDSTHGYGAGRTGKDGRTYHKDRHSGEWEPMTEAQVESVYLSGPVVDEA